jgi:DNA polymerase
MDIDIWLPRAAQTFALLMVEAREPLEGQAEKLFDAMLYSIGLNRAQVCIVDLLNQNHIEKIQPKLILSLGAQYNQVSFYEPTQTPLVMTYHPKYLLETPKNKKEAYLDMLRVKQLLINV